MGKGDKKTARGKIIAGSYGKTRQKKKRVRPVTKVMNEETMAAAASEKKAAPAKKAPAKKAAATKAKAPAAKKAAKKSK